MSENKIYETIYPRYLNNLSFFEKNYPNIYKKILVLTQSIELKEYEEKYSLDYDETEDCFNILDLQNNTFIYQENSVKKSNEIVENVNYTKDDAFSLLSIDLDKNKLLLNGFVKDLDPIKTVINDEIDFDSYEYLKIYKYLFMGVGLGLHLEGIINKLQPNIILIMEPNIEIFHLSLFTTDYESLANKTQIVFSVAENRNERLLSAHHFYKYQPYLNYVIKFNLFNEKYNNVLGDVYKKFIQEHSEAFSYTPQLIGISRTIERVNEKAKFLNLRELRQKELFGSKPALLIGAGPSAKKNIDWIKKNQNRFYIAGVSTMIPFMIEHNIKPDVLFVIDYHDLIEKFFFDENIKEFLSDTVIVLPTQVSNKVIEKLNTQNIRYLQTYDMYEDLPPAFITSNVGAYAIKVLGVLKAKNIYAIGIDSAFDQDTGSMHSSNVVRSMTFDTQNLEDKIKAKGNLRDIVYTTNELLSYKNDFESVAMILNSDNDYSFYNLSDGAYIEGYEPKEITDIDLETLEDVNKKHITENILNLYQVAKQVDYSEDIEYIVAMQKLFKKNKKLKIKNRDMLLSEQITLLSEVFTLIKKTSTPIFAQLIMEFVEVSGLYVYFYLNVKGEHIYTSQKLNNINIKWSNLAIKVLEDIKECFDKKMKV